MLFKSYNYFVPRLSWQYFFFYKPIIELAIIIHSSAHSVITCVCLTAALLRSHVFTLLWIVITIELNFRTRCWITWKSPLSRQRKERMERWIWRNSIQCTSSKQSKLRVYILLWCALYNFCSFYNSNIPIRIVLKTKNTTFITLNLYFKHIERY